MGKTVYAISACLMGVECRYDGRGNLAKELKDWLEDKEHILVCPEVMGGMSTPRAPSEIQGNRVMDNLGNDVTDYFVGGAHKAIKKMKEAGVSIAVLKSKSPSCGVGQIYDGTFSSKLIEGDGVFVQEARAAGIECYSFEEFYKLFIEKK